ncbi:hypothetical protein HZY86_04355 [Aerococcaceae bacterium DSM 111020]|nr:hypothetical protein [Aerococcaceae bacterium DSM 111020]
MRLSRRTVSILTILIAIILLSLLTVFMLSQSSVEKARKETEQLVSVDYPVETTDNFYWLTTPQETYFSLEFETTDNQKMYAIIARDGGESVYYNYDELITFEDAKSIAMNDLNPQKVTQSRLGLMNNEPVWEVTYLDENSDMGYYYLSAKDGSWIQTISNL